MRRIAAFILFGLGFCAFLVLLSPYAFTPDLFSPEEIPGTLAHDYTYNDKDTGGKTGSAEIADLMESLAGLSDSLVLELKKGDLTAAQEAFDEYITLSRNLKKIVVSYDLEDSEAGEYIQFNQLQISAVRRILNGTASIAEIEILKETTGSLDPSLLPGLTAEEKKAARQIGRASVIYNSSAEKMIEAGSVFGVDLARMRTNSRTLEVLIESAAQKAGVSLPSPASSSDLSLYVYPESGTYTTPLTITGIYSGPSPGYREILIEIDEDPWSTATTDAAGSFGSVLDLSGVSPGGHLLIAEYGTVSSKPVPFLVSASPSLLTLNCSEAAPLICTISLFAFTASGETIPVTDVPVEIMVDGEQANILTTDRAGSCSTILAFDDSTHTVQAHFSGTSVPVEEAWSEIATIRVGTLDYTAPALVLAALLICTAMAGGVLLRRRRNAPAEYSRTSSGDKGPAGAAAKAEDTPEPASPALILEEYKKRVSEENDSEAARVIGRWFRAYLSRIAGESLHPSLTLRECIARAGEKKTPFGTDEFLRRFEDVAYGGRRLWPGRDEPLIRFWSLLALSGGEEK